MKKSDIAMIILIAGVSVVLAFVIGNQLTFLKPPDKGQAVKTIAPISSTVIQPDTTVFNATAINPTVQTIVGGSSLGN